MSGVARAARFAALAVTRPLEFSDRLAGRRQRSRSTTVPDLSAVRAEPEFLAHELVGSPTCGCGDDVVALEQEVRERLGGRRHHHDGGSSLARMLWVLTRHARPSVVVETGVARGVTTAFILDALARNGHGHLWSIDLPPLEPDWADRTGEAVAEHVRNRWTYVRGAAQRKLPKVLDTTGPVDLFVHDGLHTAENMLFEFRAAWRSAAPGSFLLSDDVHHNDAVVTFAAEVGVEPVLVREDGTDDVVAVFRRPAGSARQ